MKYPLNWSRIGLHVLFWSVYLPLNALLGCVIQQQPIETFGSNLIGEAFSLPFKMLLVYFMFYYIIPLYLDRSKLSYLMLSLIAAFACAILAYRIVFVYIYFPNFGAPKEYFVFSGSGLMLTAFDCFITLAAACTIKFVRLHYKSLEFEQQLIREKLESELNFLRAQTNPHFLFNTLNNLYGLARKKSDKTADAIMMLAKIMRYVLYECRAPMVAVSAEARIIEDFIELEKLRYNKRLTVTYEQFLEEPETPIAPLLLLPFVENSFKHGPGSMTGDATIDIRLKMERQVLTFQVCNSVDPDYQTPAGGGIGLVNVRRQLDLLYPGRYELTAGQINGMYQSELTMHLND
jgi:sensor histidine kinase YesM